MRIARYRMSRLSGAVVCLLLVFVSGRSVADVSSHLNQAGSLGQPADASAAKR